MLHMTITDCEYMSGYKFLRAITPERFVEIWQQDQNLSDFGDVELFGYLSNPTENREHIQIIRVLYNAGGLDSGSSTRIIFDLRRLSKAIDTRVFKQFIHDTALPALTEFPFEGSEADIECLFNSVRKKRWDFTSVTFKDDNTATFVGFAKNIFDQEAQMSDGKIMISVDSIFLVHLIDTDTIPSNYVVKVKKFGPDIASTVYRVWNDEEFKAETTYELMCYLNKKEAK